MIDADDYYMLADSFELARYNYTGFKDTSLHFGYFSKMAGVWDSGANGTKFESMSKTSYIDSEDKKSIGDKGIVFVAIDYHSDYGHDLRIWNYYGIDLYNTLFFQYQYRYKDYEAGIQIINFKENSSLKYTDIDYSLISAKLDIDLPLKHRLDLGIAKYTDGPGQGATLGAWGGYYYYANGMIFHFFEAGSLRNSTSYKLQVGKTFNRFGLKNLWLGYRFTYFDLDSKYSKNVSNQPQSKMMLNGLRLTYGNQKGAYLRWTYEHVKLDKEPNTFAVRIIQGYKF
jgi:hypothetical protein